jgi:hypothetical protein
MNFALQKASVQDAMAGELPQGKWAVKPKGLSG